MKKLKSLVSGIHCWVKQMCGFKNPRPFFVFNFKISLAGGLSVNV